MPLTMTWAMIWGVRYTDTPGLPTSETERALAGRRRHDAATAAGKGPLRDTPPLSLAPRRRREDRLPLGHRLRPHRHPLAVHPLDEDHLVADLEASLVHLIVAEHG